jgi:hypothetical protein
MDNISEEIEPSGSAELPTLEFSRMRTLEEYEDQIIANAKYFAVVEIHPGAWRRGESNFIRSEHPTLEEARAEAQRRHDAERDPKRGSLIYAVADFKGAPNMNCLVEDFPGMAGPYTRRGRDAKLKGKRPVSAKKYEVPSPTELEKSDRFFEGPAYAGNVTNYVPAKKSQRALKFQKKRR